MRSVILLGYLVFLTMIVHPVLAVLIALLFTESTFYALRTATLTSIEATGGNVLLPLIEKGSYLIYMLLPMPAPFAERYQDVSATFRVASDQWTVLLYAAAYASTITLLFYFASLRALQRKNLM